MKRSNLIRKILLSSGFMAGIPAILIILLLKPVGSKYSLSVESAGKNSGQFAFADLNSDSISEIIYTAKGLPFYFVAVKAIGHGFYDQWNLKDSLNKNISGIFFGNFDHDKFKEIYIFTYKDDSLFLNVNEILEPHGTKMERIFITKIGNLGGEVLSLLSTAGFFDENNDGFDELYFSISSAFGIGPRKVFYFDLIHRVLESSQFTGTICLNPVMVDADGDLKPEIFGMMSASGNYNTNTPYSDSSTWFMVFNDSLRFEFAPAEFPGFANSLEIHPYSNNGLKGYLLSHWAGGADTSVMKSRIMLYDLKGNQIRYRQYSDFDNSNRITLFYIRHINSDRIYLLGDNLYELNDKLEVVRTIELPFTSEIFSYQADINADGVDEILLYSEDDEKLQVYGEGLQKLAETKLKTPVPNWKLYPYLSENHEEKLFIGSSNNGYFLTMKLNNYYYLGFLVYPVIYILIFLFILLIRKITTLQVVQRENLKQRLITLQLQGIKGQLDPHFTFNTLNSIASLIYLEDRETAYDYMNKFTQLLRGMLNDAERIYRSVGEELAFVTTYLDLERLRFGEKFNYNVEIGEGVTQGEQVPKLVLQTFVENAVKHGIMTCTEGGMIKIKISREKNLLKLSIEDNGIGRAKAAGQSTSTGKGLKLTGEFYDILNQLNKKPIKHLITDLYDVSGTPLGTRVEVWVPVD